jgi:hypothetical protein
LVRKTREKGPIPDENWLLFERNGTVGTSRDANTVKVTFFMIDDSFAILQGNGTHRAGSNAKTFAGTKI